ncbi:hypothetical protein SMICM304S_08800 [Streptomyces microflavus]
MSSTASTSTGRIPNACGLTCDTSGRDAYGELLGELRKSFGNDNLITSAITADGSDGGKIDAVDYAGAATHLDWYLPMTYDFFGAFAAQGPTAPHSPLTSYPGIPTEGFNSDAAISKLKSLGIPSEKLLLGIGFYGRGWTGVTQSEPGGSATGAAGGHVRGGHRGLQGPQEQLPRHGHGGRYGVRPLRERLVELRHPGDHRHQDDVQERAEPGRHVLLGAER